MHPSTLFNAIIENGGKGVTCRGNILLSPQLHRLRSFLRTNPVDVGLSYYDRTTNTIEMF